ncbi:MAG: aspartate aminotransferase family protein [Bacteroidota bacterium]
MMIQKATENAIMNFLAARESKIFFPTYKRLPFEVDHGEGAYLVTPQGDRYLDCFTGLGVNILGYGNQRVLQAIAQQSRRYLHLSNLFLQETQIALAEKLLQVTGYAKIFLTNSGTEAVEGALKLVRKWSKKNGKTMIFGMTNGFSGRTMGALSLTERQKYREGFEPFIPNIDHIQFNDVADLRKKIGENTAAVFLEFIQGEGGIHVASGEFVHELFKLREKFGFLVVADEIQSGIGRTGKFFAFEHYDVRPDVVTIAKPIGGGLPLGAFLGADRVADVFSTGVHGTTFGGNPVACAAGIAVLEELFENGLLQHVQTVGDLLRTGFQRLAEKYPQIIKEVRGRGLMLGIDCCMNCSSLVEEMLKRHILINCTSDTVLRFLPPFILTNEQAMEIIEALDDVFSSIHN